MMSNLRTVVLASAVLVQLAQGERVPEAAVVGGVPQGMFVGRSLLTGRAVCLLFLSGGRITRAVPEGGLESFDWNRHRAAHPGDSGTWQMRGGALVVTWGDGGVHQGPLTVNPNGIEFYGKRYSKAVPVSLAAIAGSWEAARGTAITGGAGINRISELVIATDGRYRWGSTTGGVVSGRAVAGDRSMSGTVAVKGLTIVFRSDAGTTSSHTFVPAAGSPVSAFTVDTDMFTRTGPAPATIPQASASGATPRAPADAALPPVPAARAASGASSYQGLSFTLPNGWASTVQQGHFMVVPPNPTPDTVVIVVISGAESLRGSLDDWLAAKMAADASGLRVLQTPPPTRNRSGGLDLVSVGRTIQDKTGGVILQVYHAISNGQQAGLAMVATANEGALKTHLAGVETIFQSLQFAGSPAASAPSGAGGAAAPAPPGGAAAKNTVTTADLVGHWEHGASSRSASATAVSARGYGQGYTFKADGTYTYFFSGTIDERTRFTEEDSGTWGFEEGNLVIRSRERKSVKTYRIIQFQAAPNGGANMTLLDVYYPITDSNIHVWGEKYVRQGKPGS